jgi:hypothetical protein
MVYFRGKQIEKNMTYNEAMARIGDAKNAFLLVIKERQTDSRFEMLWTLNSVPASDQELLISSLKASGFTSDFQKPEMVQGSDYFYGYSAVEFTHQNNKLVIEFLTRKIKNND